MLFVWQRSKDRHQSSSGFSLFCLNRLSMIRPNFRQLSIQKQEWNLKKSYIKNEKIDMMNYDTFIHLLLKSIFRHGYLRISETLFNSIYSIVYMFWEQLQSDNITLIFLAFAEKQLKLTRTVSAYYRLSSVQFLKKDSIPNFRL